MVSGFRVYGCLGLGFMVFGFQVFLGVYGFGYQVVLGFRGTGVVV